MVRHYNSFGGLGLIDRISQESHTSLMLLVELVKSQRLSVEKNPMEIFRPASTSTLPTGSMG